MSTVPVPTIGSISNTAIRSASRKMFCSPATKCITVKPIRSSPNVIARMSA